MALNNPPAFLGEVLARTKGALNRGRAFRSQQRGGTSLELETSSADPHTHIPASVENS
jgi:hypothetical protein